MQVLCYEGRGHKVTERLPKGAKFYIHHQIFGDICLIVTELLSGSEFGIGDEVLVMKVRPDKASKEAFAMIGPHWPSVQLFLPEVLH